MADAKKGKALNRKPSAIKAARQAKRRRIFNLRTVKTVKDVTKDIQKLAAAKDLVAAGKLLPDAQQAIDKAVKRGIINKNTAARMKSGLAKKVSVR